MRAVALMAVLLLAIASCSKTEIETKDVIITGNVPPPDYTIDSSVISLYINKAYINLLGREPTAPEKNTALVTLRQNNFSVDNRKQFIASLFNQGEYIQNLYNVANDEYLRNLDSLEIEVQRFQFNYLLGLPQYAPFYDFIHAELYRLDTLQSVLPRMYAGTMDYRAMLSRMCNNYFYDQINMGSENFVVSTFQHFFFRYPSGAELAAGKSMVDGNAATLLLNTGKSKYEYLQIFFNTDDYYEGQVRFIFIKYLFREPSPAEIFLYAGIYKNTNDYKELQKAVFSLDEYAGLR